MRLIFVRHAEPDYEHDSLTPKGFREAELLSHRAADWKADKIYLSPMGRAQATARDSLKAMGMEGETLDWLQEFDYKIADPYTGRERVPWDYFPEYYTTQQYMLDPENWYKAEIYRQNPRIEEMWFTICKELDKILASYGYERKDKYYIFRDPDGPGYSSELDDIQTGGHMEYSVRDKDDDKCIIFFCHLGVSCVMLAHLLNLSPVTLWHSFFMPASSVTVLNAEKRYHGQAAFRLQAFGDTSHLRMEGERVSGFGAFSTVFSK
ncbi:histidine phosphatase family protein [Butyrivibrio sp. MC2013]|uniref:histidine phosphatase family protein n=1 Tax=Butyrivibrio sp. MC2013 TaxID=1280686 RepID=UPI000428A95E|nr:histidine phosphatase family protein [Butyrivibrio sp. MC2013]